MLGRGVSNRSMPVTAPSDQISDQQLVSAVAAGAEWAAAMLYDRYAAKVYTLAYRLAGESSLAEDWAQEAWTRIFDGLSRFRGEASFASWLHRVAMNAILNGKRRRLRLDHVERELPEGLADRAFERSALNRSLETAIAKLPDGMRRVLVLHDVEGFNHEEIAGLLGTTESNSRSQLFRARAKVRAWLKQEDT